MTEPPIGPRPLLVEVSDGPQIRVVVSFGEGTYVGEAEAAQFADPGAAAAAATAAAVQQAVPATVSLVVPWCQLITPGEGRPDVFVVLVDVNVAGIPMQHAGAVPVKQHVSVAAARAVLDAVNRRLEIMQP